MHVAFALTATTWLEYIQFDELSDQSIYHIHLVSVLVH